MLGEPGQKRTWTLPDLFVELAIIVGSAVLVSIVFNVIFFGLFHLIKLLGSS